MAAGASSQMLNVFKKPLYNFSKEPMTGFYRDGYCRVGPDDTGNHSVAATLTDSFLNFSASRGNNLRSIGLTAGCKWCLCAARWKEALEAASKDQNLKKDVVPRVYLHASHEKALDVVSLADLKAHAAAPEAATTSGRQDSSESRKGGRLGGTGLKEKTELANPGEMTSRDPGEL